MTDDVIDELVLDACVSINLAATGICIEILRTLGWMPVMAERAAQEIGEVQPGQVVVRRSSETGDPRDLVIKVIKLNDDELSSYVRLAGDIDDGEAATLALAQGRGLAVATDDRKALRVCRTLDIQHVVGTAELLWKFSSRERFSNEEIRAILLRVQAIAHFRPRVAEPGAEWWYDVLS